MCGICGWITKQPLQPDQTARVSDMNAALIHRGPDGEGYFHADQLALAMRRLSIIDLDHGWQPLYNEDKSLVLITNGEIYNYIELREVLRAKGHHFSTGSDCETILHLYEDKGLDFVQDLRGMFAFALWDARNKRLVLGRDRMGEKPLYLFEDETGLLFASELKSLLRSGRVPFELDPAALDLYFHYGYVPEPATPLKRVRKLDAAHLLVIDIDPWQVRAIKYWDMLAAAPLTGDPAELIRAKLDEVSKLVIRADVPVGVALSGGLDSGALTALAARQYPGRLHAFCVGYEGRPSNDEREDALFLARHLDIPFHEVEISTREMVTHFARMVKRRDDPIADYSGYSYYAVMQLAREHNVPVLLQGQGGDELFWGYSWLAWAAHKTAQKRNIFERGLAYLPELRKAFPPINESARAYLLWLLKGGGLASALREYLNVSHTPARRIVFYDQHSDFAYARDHVRALYADILTQVVPAENASRLFTFDRPWPDEALLLTSLVCNTYLRENGITQGDRLSMAASVELRLPLVDYRLVETVIGLRKTQPDYRQPQKAWFRAALQGAIPSELLTRKKRGFAAPLKQWHAALFAQYGKDLADGYLVQNRILNQEAGHKLAQGEYPAETRTPLSFKALALETWCREMSACVVEVE